MKAEHDAESVEKVWRLAQSVRIAMLTLNDGKALHARPMESLIPDDWEAIWFITDRHSAKIAEAAQRVDALLTYSSGQSGDHLVMTGILSIIDDRVKLGALWNSGADQFFPKGPDDPSAILLRFEPNLAEYWKRGSGVISFALQYAKSKLLGGRATPEDHGRVVL